MKMSIMWMLITIDFLIVISNFSRIHESEMSYCQELEVGSWDIPDTAIGQNK